MVRCLNAPLALEPLEHRWLALQVQRNRTRVFWSVVIDLATSSPVILSIVPSILLTKVPAPLVIVALNDDEMQAVYAARSCIFASACLQRRQ
jgi:hypothetical protein